MDTTQFESFEHYISNLDFLDSFTDVFEMSNFDQNSAATCQEPSILTNINDFSANSTLPDSYDSFLVQSSDSSSNYNTSPIQSTNSTLNSSETNDISDSPETIASQTNFSTDPISILFTDPNNQNLQFTSEIIFNFDRIESESCLKQIEKEIEGIKESFKVVIEKFDTTVELNEKSTDEDDDSSDEADQSTEVGLFVFYFLLILEENFQFISFFLG